MVTGIAQSARLRAPRRAPERLPTVLSVAPALPSHYRDQEALIDAAKRHWIRDPSQHRGLERLFRNTGVDGRYFALSVDEMAALRSFEDANGAYIRCAVELGERAVSDALARAGLAARDVDHVFFASVTGIATPSIDARIANRLELRRDVKRTPIFGLGCVAGAAGLARASDYLRAYPDEVALLLTVELCSLTLQRDDASVRNLIAGGLFGDGAAAVVLGGCAGAGGGHLPSASVLLVLEETMLRRRPRAGSPGLLIGMGPGFCAELVLLAW